MRTTDRDMKVGLVVPTFIALLAALNCHVRVKNPLPTAENNGHVFRYSKDGTLVLEARGIGGREDEYGRDAAWIVTLWNPPPCSSHRPFTSGDHTLRSCAQICQDHVRDLRGRALCEFLQSQLSWLGGLKRVPPGFYACHDKYPFHTWYKLPPDAWREMWTIFAIPELRERREPLELEHPFSVSAGHLLLFRTLGGDLREKLAAPEASFDRDSYKTIDRLIARCFPTEEAKANRMETNFKPVLRDLVFFLKVLPRNSAPRGTAQRLLYDVYPYRDASRPTGAPDARAYLNSIGEEGVVLPPVTSRPGTPDARTNLDSIGEEGVVSTPSPRVTIV